MAEDTGQGDAKLDHKGQPDMWEAGPKMRPQVWLVQLGTFTQEVATSQ